MFRSIRDLLLRPGYMIRDYLRGMQMAYFPPFKMFFLLCALSLLIDSGMNIKGINRGEQNEKETNELFGLEAKTKQVKAQEKKAQRTAGKPLTKEEKKQLMIEEDTRIKEKSTEWINQHTSGMMLFGLLLYSLPLWLLFRHSPAIPDIRLSECFVAQVYISNMLIIYSIVPSLLCFSVKAEIVFDLLSMLLIIIPIKQLSGYSYWSTIWRVALATILLFILFLLLYAVIIFIYMYIRVNMS